MLELVIREATSADEAGVAALLEEGNDYHRAAIGLYEKLGYQTRRRRMMRRLPRS